MTQRLPLPTPVAKIFEAVAELERLYPGRRFTPDGHLVGSIGEVVAAEALGLTLYPASNPEHDGHDGCREVQIKTIGTRAKGVSMYATSDRSIVLQFLSATQIEIIFDGDGASVWDAAGKVSLKNGQRVISLKKLRMLAEKCC